MNRKTKKAGIAYAGAIEYVLPYFAASLFWSVIGPAAPCNFDNPEYVYAALLKP